jgi:hypothetical protein
MRHSYSTPELNEIIELLDKSIKSLFQNDRYLLCSHTGENTISHRLAIYLENNLLNKDFGFNVDCEYMKDGVNRKRIDGHRRIPDIIIHKRGNNYPTNYLCVYAKRYENINSDLDNIKGFLKDNYYNKFGCFVKYFESNNNKNPNKIDYTICYYENGYNDAELKTINRTVWRE